MKQGLGSKIRERMRSAEGKRRADPPEGQERSVIEEVAAEFTTEELQEFLEADLYPVKADPEFKESLRRRLWDLVQRQARPDDEGH